jgi:hypothetical protein
VRSPCRSKRRAARAGSVSSPRRSMRRAREEAGEHSC